MFYSFHAERLVAAFDQSTQGLQGRLIASQSTTLQVGDPLELGLYDLLRGRRLYHGHSGWRRNRCLIVRFRLRRLCYCCHRRLGDCRLIGFIRTSEPKVDRGQGGDSNDSECCAFVHIKLPEISTLNSVYPHNNAYDYAYCNSRSISR